MRANMSDDLNAHAFTKCAEYQRAPADCKHDVVLYCERVACAACLNYPDLCTCGEEFQAFLSRIGFAVL